MRRTKLAGLLAVTAVAALGSTAPADAASGSTTPAPERGAVNLTKGETLTVRVAPAASGSTGYHWRVTSAKSRSILRLRSNRPSASGSRQVLRFTARRSGYTHLRLAYVSPGRERKVADRFNVRVVVNAAEPQYTCSLSATGARTLAYNGAAEVFTLRRTVVVYIPGRGGVRLGYTAFYACDYATDSAYLLSNPNSRDQVYNLTLNGSIVAFALSPACPLTAEGGTICSGASKPTIRSVDLKTGNALRRVGVLGCGEDPEGGSDPSGPECYNGVTGLVVSPSGGLAWIEGARDSGKPFHVRRSDKPAEAGQPASDAEFVTKSADGPVDPTSLRYDGSEITYVQDGKVRRAPLR